MRLTREAVTCLLLLIVPGAEGATYYVAPGGNDAWGGSLAQPFASITRAQQAAVSGDTVYLRGGTYTNFTVAAQDTTYQYAVKLSTSNVYYLAFPGDARPVFDFSGISPDTKRVCGVLLSGNGITVDGIDVTGVRAGAQKQADNWRISGSGNTVRNVVTRDDEGNGMYLLGYASNNLIENCDSYNLVGISGTSAGNTDGFGCHSAGSGNVFRGDRAWGNSDDGFDCISNSGGGVVFDHCWAYDNGRYDGNKTGFKIGGFGASGGAFPNPPPVHTVQFCLSAKNGANGFYANHQPGQAANWLNNTAYNNRGANFNMLEAIDTSPANASVPGTREVLHNNLAYVGTGITNLDESGEMVANNWFTLPVTVTAADFQSLDATQMTLPRKADGSLPDITFMHLVEGSDLIDAGMDVGLSFGGVAPDLGAFELPSPRLIIVTAAYAGGTIAPDTVMVLDHGARVTGPVRNNGSMEIRQTGPLAVDAAISGTGTLSVTGGGVVSLTRAGSFFGPTRIERGTLQVVDPAALAGSLVTPLAGGTLTIAPGVHATVAGLDVAGGGVIDVGLGMVTVTAGLTESDVVGALQAGRGDGRWAGSSGITSSAVAVAIDGGLMRTIGWLEEEDGSVTFGYAAPGDTNLDGTIDLIDAANFTASGAFDSGALATWAGGDSNGDRVLDLLDAAEFAGTGLFDQGRYGPAPAGVMPVPEPSGLGPAMFATLTAIALTAGRRRRGDRVVPYSGGGNPLLGRPQAGGRISVRVSLGETGHGHSR